MKSKVRPLNIHVSPLSDAYLGTGHLGVSCRITNIKADYPPTAPPAPSKSHKYGRGGHGVLLRAIRT
eukprot:scaffold19129_cov208-Skeletonema_marinoi.AAC.1